MYDPSTNTWTLGASIPTARQNPALGAINGVIYAMGGLNPSILNMFQSFARKYPGTNEDLTLTSGINLGAPSGGLGYEVKAAVAGNAVTVKVESKGGTFILREFLLIAQAFPTGSPPVPAVPGIWLGFPGLTFMIGTVYGPLGTIFLPPGGTTVSMIVPPGLTGNSVLIQGAVLAPIAINGVYATTDAHEITL
jgi:hypothetical protein